MQSWGRFLSAAASRSRFCRLCTIPRPTLLGQLHDHGSQLWWVVTDGCIRNGWSNCTDTKHQWTAVIVRERIALISQVWIRTGAITAVWMCSSNAIFLKRKVILCHKTVHVIFKIFKISLKKKKGGGGIYIPPFYKSLHQWSLLVTSFHLELQEFYLVPLQEDECKQRSTKMNKTHKRFCSIL